MLRTKAKGIFSIVLGCAQLLILLGSFLAFSSTIEILPWYEPLTMGAFFCIIELIPVQIVFTIIYLIKYSTQHPRSSIKLISIINEMMLLIAFISALINEAWFYPVCLIMAFLEISLIIFMIWRVYFCRRSSRKD